MLLTVHADCYLPSDTFAVIQFMWRAGTLFGEAITVGGIFTRSLLREMTGHGGWRKPTALTAQVVGIAERKAFI